MEEKNNQPTLPFSSFFPFSPSSPHPPASPQYATVEHWMSREFSASGQRTLWRYLPAVWRFTRPSPARSAVPIKPFRYGCALMTSTVNCQMTQGSQDHCRYQRIGCPRGFLGLPGGVLGGYDAGKSCGEGYREVLGVLEVRADLAAVAADCLRGRFLVLVWNWSPRLMELDVCVGDFSSFSLLRNSLHFWSWMLV